MDMANLAVSRIIQAGLALASEAHTACNAG